MKKSKHQEFIESLISKENPIGDEEHRKLAERARLHPMMPRKYNAEERARIRAAEKKIFDKLNENAQPNKDIER